MKASRVVVSMIALTTVAMVGCNSSQKTSSSASSEAKVVDTSKPVNAKCPMKGSPVGPNSVLASYQDKTVGFCCSNCASSWAKLSNAEKDTKLAAAMK